MEAQNTEGRRNPYSSASSSSSFGGGGKLRSARKGSNTKSTPYDRPSSLSQSRGLPSVPSSSSSSIASRVVNTASRLITSSASYVFSSFFGAGRNSLRIKSGQDEGAITDRHKGRAKGKENDVETEIEKEKEKERDKEEEQNEGVGEEEDEEVEVEEPMDEFPLKEERQARKDNQAPYPNREELTKPGNTMRRDELSRAKVSWGPNTEINSLEHNSRALEPGGSSLDGSKKGSDLIQVEEMLKQKTLSRDEVDRLTGLLLTRVTDDSVSEDIIVTPRMPEKPTPSIRHTQDENFVAPMSEAQRWREERKKARLDLTPIEVARAYMGERTSLPTGLTLTIRGIDQHQVDKVSKPQPQYGSGLLGDRCYQQTDKASEVQLHSRLGDRYNHQVDKSFELQQHILGDKYRPSPMARSSVRASSALRMPKQGQVLDEGWMSVGPVRRSRQMVFQTMNPSPYARPANLGQNLTPRQPPMQSSHTARKILDTLEKLSPSPKGRTLDGDFNPSVERTPLGLETDRYGGRTIPEFSRFSNFRSGASNGKLDFDSISKTPLMKKPLPLPPPPISFSNVKEGSPVQDKGASGFSHPEAPAKFFGSNAPSPAMDVPDKQGLLMGMFKEESKPTAEKLVFSSGKMSASNDKPPFFGSFGVPPAPLTTPTVLATSRKEEESASEIPRNEEYPLKDILKREEHSAKENAFGTFESSKSSNVALDFVSNNSKESNASAVGASQSSSVFSFKPGNNSFAVSATGAEIEVSTTSSFSFFKPPQLSAMKSVQSNIMAASSLQPSPFSFVKPVASSQQMDMKPQVSSVSNVSTSFSFSPIVAPMPCVSAPPVSSSEDVSSLGPVFSFTSPPSGGMKIPDSTFAPDELLPEPTFTFGGSEQKSSSISVPSPQSTSLLSSRRFDSGVFGSSSKPASAVFGSTLFGSASGAGLTGFGKPSGAGSTGFGLANGANSMGSSSVNGFGLVTGSTSATAVGSTSGSGSHNGFGSVPFGSTFGSGSVVSGLATGFGSAAGSDSAVFGSTSLSGSDSLPTTKFSTSSPMTSFDLGGGLSSSSTGLEKSGRKFIKVKRRK